MGGEGDEAVEEEAEPAAAAASTAAGCRRRGHSGAHGAGHVRAHNTTNHTCHLMFVEGVAPLGVDSLGRILGMHTRLSGLITHTSLNESDKVNGAITHLRNESCMVNGSFRLGVSHRNRRLLQTLIIVQCTMTHSQGRQGCHKLHCVIITTVLSRHNHREHSCPSSVSVRPPPLPPSRVLPGERRTWVRWEQRPTERERARRGSADEGEPAK